MSNIVKQLQYDIKYFNIKGSDIETVFIGGGTPSTIEPKLYESFFEIISPYLKENCEITIEANPNSTTLFWLQEMRDLGVNRVSFGVQSFKQEKLKLLGRNHTPRHAVQAVENAHRTGFQNISLDLIYATAIDTKDILLQDLKTAFSMPINHISTYSLTIEEGTNFFNTPEVSNDNVNLAVWFSDEIKKRGLQQYEISNYGKYKSKHNLGYWSHKNYLGIGSGAVGFFKDTRYYPLKNIEAYIKDPLCKDAEKLSIENIKTEQLFLGLRSEIGFAPEILNENELKRAKFLVEENKIIYKNNRFFNRNYFLSDEIALFILS